MDTTVEASSIAGPTHDKNVAADFLATLDPTASRFTFQFFGDGDDRYAEVSTARWMTRGLRSWPPILLSGVSACSSPSTRRTSRAADVENIVRPRALFVDADDA